MINLPSKKHVLQTKLAVKEKLANVALKTHILCIGKALMRRVHLQNACTYNEWGYCPSMVHSGN